MATPAAERLQTAGRHARQAADAAAQRGVEHVQPLLDYELLRIAGLSVTTGGLLAAVLALLAAWLLSRGLRGALTRFGQRHTQVNRASLYMLSQLLHYTVLAVGVIVALQLAGIPLGRFAVFGGALGVGLGFGLQAIFNNFISGLILLFDRSLKIGDFVELESGVHGEVRDIKIRATTIVTNDNLNILVPNSEFVSGRVVNWTYGAAMRRLRVPFRVAYGTAKELVKKAALEAACEVPFTLAHDGPRGPQVWLVKFGDFGLQFELVVWLNAEATKRPSTVIAAYLWALDTALCKYGIEIPFPQQDLHLRSVFGHEGDEGLAAWRGERVQQSGPVPHVAAPATDTRLAGTEREQLLVNDAERDVHEPVAPAPEPTPPPAGTAAP